jgi:hypothetical protein
MRSTFLAPLLILGLAAIPAVSITACGDDDAPAAGAAGATAGGSAGASGSDNGGSAGSAPVDGPLLAGDCDPLVPTQCGYPFPSNVWTKKDSSTKTGLRVAFGATTLPSYEDGAKYMSPTWYERLDGFSSGVAPLTHLPGATSTGLPTQDTIETSLDAANSPTILLDATTGELIPHWAEIDMSAKVVDAEERSFMIRPVIRIPDGHRVIVAIRRVKDAAGADLPAGSVFAALRDGTDHEDVSVARRRDLYADIFAKLQTAGVGKDDLQIAWDYTIASTESNTQDVLFMRDTALAIVGDEGPAYTIDHTEDAPNDQLRKRYHLKMTVPSFMTTCLPGASMNRGDDGLPKQNGTCECDVIVHIPKDGATADKPAGLIQNGHGLLGERTEGQNGYLARFANEKNYVAFSVDFIGFAHDDVSDVVERAGKDIGAFRDMVDRQQQGLVNSLLAMRMMKGRFVKEPSLLEDGKPVIDPSVAAYRGDSQGGIMGTSYMALTTDVTHGLLGEPGMPYNLLLARSVDFGLYFTILNATYGKNRPTTLALALVQTLWDHSEPNGFAPFISGNPLPNTPDHTVLIHAAIGDHQVTPLGAHIIARTVGAKNITPVNRSVWGIEETAAPYTGNAMVEFSFGLPDAPKENIPMSQGDDPHDTVRGLKSAFDQSDGFFRTGTVQPVCDGPCDPE